MKNAVTFLILFSSLMVNAQIISQFNWNSGSPLTATVGPNATSVSSSAVISAGGRGGTNGLNAGLPKMDLNLTIPGSPTFNVPGIDLSIDYQRDESVIDLVRRGNSLILSGGNNLFVSYRVSDGAGGFVTVNSGNVYTIPNDDTYRTYRFMYVPSTGVGTLLVENTTVWTNDGPDNRNLFWTAADNVVLGAMGDGSGANKAFFDNLIIGSITTTPLPIELTYFKVKKQLNDAKIEWETASEINNDYFTIEKSYDAEEWNILTTVNGQGNSSTSKKYYIIDQEVNPNKSTYYRLKQTDFNGDFSYSEIEFISGNRITSDLVVYPNPASDEIRITNSSPNSTIFIYDLTGKLHLEESGYESGSRIDVSHFPRGQYILMQKGLNQLNTQKIILK
tara:strand:- start:656 stop:1828 length:1173 start_codon:yes stop_codon:yes gene_type:complete